MSSRIVVVFGVTGVQGASVARALLSDGFRVRGITRNPDSRGSKSMADLGVELVKGDLDEPASYSPALKGADGVFINANFWASYNGSNAQEAKAKEIKQSSAAADASAAAGVGLIVYSTLESFQPRQELPHFDAKAAVTEHIRKLGVPATQLFTSYYYSNLLGMQPEENDCGEIELSLGIPADSEMPAFDSTQIGLWARVAFRDPKQWAGKDMYACGDVITPRKIAQTLSELSGKKYVPAPITREEFMQMSERMDYELWLNYLAFVNGEWKRDPAASRKLVPEAHDFKTWCLNDPAAAQNFGPFGKHHRV